MMQSLLAYVTRVTMNSTHTYCKSIVMTLLLFTLVVPCTSMAESAPFPDEAAPTPPSGVEIYDSGTRCKVSEDLNSDAEEECRRLLLPRRPVISVQTPGSFIIGKAWGKDGNAVVFGPAVGLGVTVGYPLVTSSLQKVSGNNGLAWQLPTDAQFVANMNFALSGNLVGLTIDVDDETVDDSQMGFTAGAFVGPEFGLAWFDGNAAQRTVLAIGVVGAYLGQVDGLGPAFLLGVQPSLIVDF